MRFDVTRMKTNVQNLSGGERMRLRFAIAFGLKPDFIILDEPTNHIDEVTWEILLQACKNSKSSILLVTHDYEFIQEFNSSVFWMIHDQKVVARHKELDTLLEELSK
jgi:ATPase subunit of ABC transporter with duplicated ATPase domains